MMISNRKNKIIWRPPFQGEGEGEGGGAGVFVVDKLFIYFNLAYMEQFLK